MRKSGCESRVTPTTCLGGATVSVFRNRRVSERRDELVDVEDEHPAVDDVVPRRPGDSELQVEVVHDLDVLDLVVPGRDTVIVLIGRLAGDEDELHVPLHRDDSLERRMPVELWRVNLGAVHGSGSVPRE
jgi:hypothetical protein